jgi:hypothetical protein
MNGRKIQDRVPAHMEDSHDNNGLALFGVQLVGTLCLKVILHDAVQALGLACRARAGAGRDGAGHGAGGALCNLEWRRGLEWECRRVGRRCPWSARSLSRSKHGHRAAPPGHRTTVVDGSSEDLEARGGNEATRAARRIGGVVPFIAIRTWDGVYDDVKEVAGIEAEFGWTSRGVRVLGTYDPLGRCARRG